MSVEKKSILFPIVIAIVVSFSFVMLSTINRKIAYGYGYGYNTDKEDIAGHKTGVIWKSYKHYRDRYKKTENRYLWYKISYLRKSKDPVLNGMFWEMKNIYDTHKFDSDEIFAKLSPNIQEKFRIYKEYNGYNKYRNYKKRVY